MHIFDEYRNLGRNNYILFIGKMMTSFGSMVFFNADIDSFSEINDKSK